MGSDSERLGCYGGVMGVFIAVLFSMPVFAAIGVRRVRSLLRQRVPERRGVRVDQNARCLFRG